MEFIWIQYHLKMKTLVLIKTKEDEEKLWEFYHTAISKEEWDKYKSFEDYSKRIANENCILCIFEYVKETKDLNKEKTV